MTYSNAAHIDREFAKNGINAVAAKHDMCWVIIERGNITRTADSFDDICRHVSEMIKNERSARSL